MLTALLVYSEFVNSISAPSSIKGVFLVVSARVPAPCTVCMGLASHCNTVLIEAHLHMFGVHTSAKPPRRQGRRVEGFNGPRYKRIRS